ncbi:MAG: DUF4097 family beta strand repeat protein [Firmicutes bacterium]|nr:DUF4097 family beta strand repeat protein [Bacillota bacterium]
MKKNVYLGILAIITTACILLGSMYHFTDLFSFRGHSSGRDSKTESKADMTVLDDIGEFHSIDCDIDIASLTIQPGDSYNVSWHYKNDNEPEARVENGVLKLTQKSRNNILNLKQLAGIHEMDLNVTVPAGAQLDAITIKADIAEISVQGLSAKTCTISTDVGDIDLAGLKIPNLSVSCDTGDVDINTSEFTMLSVESDVGDIDIDTIDDPAAYSMDLKTDVGTVEVNGNDHGRHYQAAGSGGKTITVTTDTGEIEID